VKPNSLLSHDHWTIIERRCRLDDPVDRISQQYFDAFSLEYFGDSL
jgi:hypothetical protein